MRDTANKATLTDVSLAEVQGRWTFRMKIVDATAIPLTVLATGVPLFLMYLAVKELAGKDTYVNVAVQLGLAISITATPAIIHAFIRTRKMNKQREELVRCRERVEMLERWLADLNKRSTDGGKQ